MSEDKPKRTISEELAIHAMKCVVACCVVGAAVTMFRGYTSFDTSMDALVTTSKGTSDYLERLVKMVEDDHDTDAKVTADVLSNLTVRIDRLWAAQWPNLAPRKRKPPPPVVFNEPVQPPQMQMQMQQALGDVPRYSNERK